MAGEDEEAETVKAEGGGVGCFPATIGGFVHADSGLAAVDTSPL